MSYHMAWLHYEKSTSKNQFFDKVLIDKAVSVDSLIHHAMAELQLFAQKAFEKEIRIIYDAADEMTADARYALYLHPADGHDIQEEGYGISVEYHVHLYAKDSKGFLLGVFRAIQLFRMEKLVKGMTETRNPSNPLRMLNHWDNMDGSVERGYSGKSFFFADGKIIVDERTKDYARLIASIGINGVVINNVNVKDEATYLITGKYREKLCAMAGIFAGYGIKLYLSVNFAAPMEIGGLSTADPLDEHVIKWWADTAKDIFENIPNLGGFLVKADSEGRPGPFTYGRDHADGANMLAHVIKPYGGLVIWRCFVYNCQQDWRDRKTDRARAGYDHFRPLDGKFADNVILQIKNGPMDFQVREPVSPLIGAMEHTNQMLEFQIAQEYTGHQIDLCYLIPLFKEVLAFRTYCREKDDKISDIVSGKTYGNMYAGIVAVTNTGNDLNWTGHDMAAANLYGFGQLCFDHNATAEAIAEEWIRLTYGNDGQVIQNVLQMLLSSRAIYEKYTVPLGIGWMVNPGYHYGPNVDGYEYDRWGTYHRADNRGLGVDRSSKGTGYVGQYNRPNAEAYESIATCPEELLLFFHYVPYNHVLSTGKTLIQHIYDTHFEGVEEVEAMIGLWEALKGHVTSVQYESTGDRLQRQLLNAKEWRDVVCSYFFRKSGVEDEKQRTIY